MYDILSISKWPLNIWNYEALFHSLHQCFCQAMLVAYTSQKLGEALTLSTATAHVSVCACLCVCARVHMCVLRGHKGYSSSEG